MFPLLTLLRFLRPTGRGEAWGLVVVLLGAACGGGGYLLWRHVGETALAVDDYWLQTTEIVVQPEPQWLAVDDLRAQVIRDASLEQRQNLLDKKLVERIGLAFAAHPWVEKVVRVEKFHPARIEVHLEYRTPVAGVVVGTQLLPIDGHGVVLPSENFPPAELAKFPRITGVLTRPAQIAGVAWSDNAVQGAAIIADAFGEDWQPLGLAEIYCISRETTRGMQHSFVLVTLGGAKIPWGAQPPRNEPNSGLSAEEKVSRLKAYVQEHGSLDGVARAEGDLRTGRVSDLLLR